MDTLVICAVVILSAIGLAVFLRNQTRGSTVSPEEQARLAELVARTVRDDIAKETDRLRSAQAQQANDIRKELTDGLR